MSTESLSYHLHAPNIIAVSIGLPIAGALLVATRFRIRKTQKTRVSIDDWLILVALVSVRENLVRGLGSDVRVSEDDGGGHGGMFGSW